MHARSKFIFSQIFLEIFFFNNYNYVNNYFKFNHNL